MSLPGRVSGRRARLLLSLIIVGLFAWSTPLANGRPEKVSLPVTAFRIVERESGPVNYYRVINVPPRPYIRGYYLPRFKTAVFGYQFGRADRGATTLTWNWRAITLPRDGDECRKGRRDSAAVVYVIFRHGMRWYTLKYIWSTTGAKGAVCDRQRNAFVAQDTIVLESGGPLNTWRTETIDIRAEFRRHFADGDPNARVPSLRGIGVMTDGDQTRSESAADFADFVITR